MAELVNAYINWQVCEMGEVPDGNLDEIYPVPPLPRVRAFHHHFIPVFILHLPFRPYPPCQIIMVMARQAHFASLDLPADNSNS